MPTLREPEPRIERFDVPRLVDDLLQKLAEGPTDDPLVVELSAAFLLDLDAVLAEQAIPGDDVLEGLLFNDFMLPGDAIDSDQLDELLLDNGYQSSVDEAIPLLEARGTTEAVAMLLALGTMAVPDHAKQARAAADRLMTSGIVPATSAELAEPPVLKGCLLLQSSPLSVLAGTFERTNDSHAAIVIIDESLGGAAMDIHLIRAEMLPMALADIKNSIDKDRPAFTEKELTPTAFWLWVQDALDMRSTLRHDPDFTEALADIDDAGPPFSVRAALLEARSGQYVQPLTHRYQIKVTLAGSTPSIWRRLDVPADLSLAQLHGVIQIAFDWDDSHLHMFKTEVGTFGVPDPGDDGRIISDQRTLLTDVADVGSTFDYVYDFGDDWQHAVTVEERLPPDESDRAPRCIEGEQAAPPEDSGGIPGYFGMLDSLADPQHPDHHDRLDWLGLDEPGEFDPTAFELERINQDLAEMYRRQLGL